MNASIVLCGEDHVRLRSLLNHDCPGPWPAPEQAAALEEILRSAEVTENERLLDSHAGLGDQIALVSVSDPGDFFSLQVVLPHEANVDLDRIPVILPISLAVLGRPSGEVVSWDTSHGIREMQIAAIRKCARPAMAG